MYATIHNRADTVTSIYLYINLLRVYTYVYSEQNHEFISHLSQKNLTHANTTCLLHSTSPNDDDVLKPVHALTLTGGLSLNDFHEKTVNKNKTNIKHITAENYFLMYF